MKMNVVCLVALLWPLLVEAQRDSAGDKYEVNCEFVCDRVFYSLLEEEHFLLGTKKDWSVAFWENSDSLKGFSQFFPDHGFWSFESENGTSFTFQYSHGLVEVTKQSNHDSKESAMVFYEVGDSFNNQRLIDKWLLPNSSGGYKLAGKSARIINDKGYFLAELGYYAEAVKLFEFVVLYHPTRVVTYINLGDSYWDMKEKDKAKEAYEIYMKLMTEDGKQAKIPLRVRERLNL